MTRHYYFTNLILISGILVAAFSLQSILSSTALGKVVFNHEEQVVNVPIATSGNNAYLAWSSNKTGNDEVMFKASTDGGKTFSNKMNLSNTPKSESQDTQITAAGSNVYVSWWERNATSNEPVLRVSNDNGKTFGEKIMLSSGAK
jgi:uncharacterized protein (UPF0333 family)